MGRKQLDLISLSAGIQKNIPWSMNAFDSSILCRIVVIVVLFVVTLFLQWYDNLYGVFGCESERQGEIVRERVNVRVSIDSKLRQNFVWKLDAINNIGYLINLWYVVGACSPKLEWWFFFLSSSWTSFALVFSFIFQVETHQGARHCHSSHSIAAQ